MLLVMYVKLTPDSLFTRVRDVSPPTEGRPTERDGVLVETLRQGRHGQVMDAGPACTHSEYCDVICVAPVVFDVVLNPSSFMIESVSLFKLLFSFPMLEKITNFNN